MRPSGYGMPFGLGLVVAIAGLLVGAAPAEADTPSPAPSFKLPKHDNTLRDGRVARGNRNILAAWFSEPTRGYARHALGGEVEPKMLVVSTAKRLILRFKLPKHSVFEDREPRIVDVDGDGLDEVLVVRSYFTKGSAVAIIGVKGATLSIVAETEPTGMPFQWVNPAGVGDFDGDGKRDIAVVRRPHRLGELDIYTLKGRRLERIMTVPDVSNHALGKRDQRLSLVRDFNGDGIVDLAIPSFDRHVLQVLSFKDRRVNEIASYILPARASGNFRIVKRRRREMMAIGIGGGRYHYIPVPSID